MLRDTSIANLSSSHLFTFYLSYHDQARQSPFDPPCTKNSLYSFKLSVRSQIFSEKVTVPVNKTMQRNDVTSYDVEDWKPLPCGIALIWKVCVRLQRVECFQYFSTDVYRNRYNLGKIRSAVVPHKAMT